MQQDNNNHPSGSHSSNANNNNKILLSNNLPPQLQQDYNFISSFHHHQQQQLHHDEENFSFLNSPSFINHSLFNHQHHQAMQHDEHHHQQHSGGGDINSAMNNQLLLQQQEQLSQLLSGAGGGGTTFVAGFPGTFLELLNFHPMMMEEGNISSSYNHSGHSNSNGSNGGRHHGTTSSSDILIGKTNSETILFHTSPTNNENSSNGSSGGGDNNRAVSTTVQADQEGEEFSPIACDHCRSQHRKCDKRKPACYSCQQRGISCHYRESKRNLKKKPNIQPPPSLAAAVSTTTTTQKKSNSFEPYAAVGKAPVVNKNSNKSSSSSELTALTSTLSKPNMIDFYYDVVAGGYPLISRPELEFFAAQFDDTQDVNQITEFEMTSLYFSIKALCECQYGLHEQAEVSAEKAKKCLSRVFDKFSSFMVGGAYVHLIMYELWSGRFENCKFYLQILTFFEKKLFPQDSCDQVDSMSEFQENLQGWIFYFDRIVFVDNKDLRDITVEDILKKLPSIFEFLHKKPFPSEWTKALNTEITAENCFEIWSLVEMILNQSKTIERSVISSSESSKFYLEIIELVYQFILDGARIAILSKSPQKDSMVISGMIHQSAQQITSLTENPWFPVFPLELVAFLNAAASVHLEKAKVLRSCSTSSLSSQSSSSTVFVYNNVDYLSLLRKDLRAYNVFRSKYKAASVQPSEVCLAIEKFLHEIDTSFENNSEPIIEQTNHGELHVRLEEFLDEFLLDQ